MASAIEIRDLWIRYRGEEEYAVKNVSLRVGEGEFILIMGPSGCGKTTLCYAITGIIPRTLRAEVKGVVKVFGLDPASTPPHKLSRYIGIVFQNPEMQLVTTSVYEEVAFPLENLGFPPKEIEERVEEVLEVVGLRGLEDRSPASLSGGQKQALAIASVLALRPRIIVVDEPTSQLDPQGTRRITGLIAKLREEYGITILAVEHRVEWAVEYADRIIVMTGGSIRLEGTPEEIFSKRMDVEEVGFRPPQVSEIAYQLIDRGVNVPRIPVTLEDAVRVFGGLVEDGRAHS